MGGDRWCVLCLVVSEDPSSSRRSPARRGGAKLVEEEPNPNEVRAVRVGSRPTPESVGLLPRLNDLLRGLLLGLLSLGLRVAVVMAQEDTRQYFGSAQALSGSKASKGHKGIEKLEDFGDAFKDLTKSQALKFESFEPKYYITDFKMVEVRIGSKLVQVWLSTTKGLIRKLLKTLKDKIGVSRKTFTVSIRSDILIENGRWMLSIDVEFIHARLFGESREVRDNLII
ncbi:hypothetical protein Syun_003675 [Stephania yunnanensis]|uniref:Uncharacterized protein n=1 Tax=Stephania yunnanensis TaxID=152371 RepID=A0AAP0Q0F6_9MAGN